MKVWQKALVLISGLGVAFLVYSPHLNYSYPFHVDEWHHISQALRIGSGAYVLSFQSAELGFHLFLFLLSTVTDLVSVYRFLPAITALVSASIIFFLTYRVSNSFWTGIAALFFFATIKSNVNVTGIWFFTPLSFAIPLIYAYLYAFYRAGEEGSALYLKIGILLFALLIPIHAVSALMSLPALCIYGIIQREKLQGQMKYLYALIGVLVGGTFFFTWLLPGSVLTDLTQLFSLVQFRYGWGVVEMENSLTELYSSIGYIFAIIGVISLAIQKTYRHYVLFLILPITLLVSILLFKLTGISLLSPYQRNLYYFTLILPLFSALGLVYLFSLIQTRISVTPVRVLILLVLVGITASSLHGYGKLPARSELYYTINDAEYKALRFLREYPEGRVMAEALPSVSVYALSGHEPVASLVFDGKQNINDTFMHGENCATKRAFLYENPEVRYILSTDRLTCGWIQLYAKGTYVYQTRE